MIAELETISMAARKRLCVGVHPMRSPAERAPANTSNAPQAVARTVAIPIRRNRRMLSPIPTENIRKTSPSCESVWIRSKSETNANGGEYGPTTIPASKKPTTDESPARWQSQPAIPAAPITIARSCKKSRPAISPKAPAHPWHR